MRAPAFGLTIAGLGFGALLLGGPLGIAAGAGLGLLGDHLRHSHRASHPLTEHHLRAVRRAAPHLDDESIQAKASIAGTSPPVEAVGLLSYLKRAARHRHHKDFWAAQKTRALIASFQKAWNRDREAMRGLGPLHVSGKFDPATSGALAVYVHETVSPDPGATGGGS
jgi:hypothetical protein